MRPVPIILLSCILSLFSSVPGGAEPAEDYLAVFGPGGRLGYPGYYEYTPAFAEFMARDYWPGSTSPVYLGRTSYREPVRIGHAPPAFAELAGARWHPIWPYNDSPTHRARFIPASDPLSIEEYHVPSIVEFLKPDWRPEGINYSYYVPALGEFANASWKPPQANYSLHVPAIGEFLSEEWQPPGPNPADYPLWMTEYLWS